MLITRLDQSASGLGDDDILEGILKANREIQRTVNAVIIPQREQWIPLHRTSSEWSQILLKDVTYFFKGEKAKASVEGSFYRCWHEGPEP